MSRLIRIIAHQSDKGILLDVMTADGATSVTVLLDLRTPEAAILAMQEAASTFFHKPEGVTIPGQLQTIVNLEQQAKELETHGIARQQ